MLLSYTLQQKKFPTQNGDSLLIHEQLPGLAPTAADTPLKACARACGGVAANGG